MYNLLTKSLLLIVSTLLSFYSYSADTTDSHMADIVAKVVSCEDGRSVDTISHVVSVLHNRADVKFGRRRHNIEELFSVVSEKNQFSCYKIVLGGKKSYSNLSVSKEVVAESLEAGWSPVTVATMFYAKGLCNPKWAYSGKFKVVAQFGHHVFMAPVVAKVTNMLALNTIGKKTRKV